MDQIITIAPWIIGLLTTILALKKDWITGQFTRKEKSAELADVVSNTYQRLLDDIQVRFDSKVIQLEADVERLSSLLLQMEMIIKSYKDKYGDI